MGLAIDGNVVHGIARGGQAFISLGNTNADGSININGKTYYPFAINPSGEYNITGTDYNNKPFEIDFTISKDGNLTVNWATDGKDAQGASLAIDDVKVTKQPL